MYAYFNELPVKTVFHRNGNIIIKQSTRTGKLEYGKTFYFRKRTLCIVDKYSRLSADYFDTNNNNKCNDSTGQS